MESAFSIKESKSKETSSTFEQFLNDLPEISRLIKEGFTEYDKKNLKDSKEFEKNLTKSMEVGYQNNETIFTPSSNLTPDIKTDFKVNITSEESINGTNISSISTTIDNETERNLNYFHVNLMLKFIARVLNDPLLFELITAEEKEYLYNLQKLDRMVLYVALKLFIRQDAWYSYIKFMASIDLREDPETSNGLQNKILNLLKTYSLIDHQFPDNIEKLLNFLDMNQLKELLNTLKIKSSFCNAKKPLIISTLLMLCREQCTLTQYESVEDVIRRYAIRSAGTCVKISAFSRDLFYRVMLLNTYPNITLRDPVECFKYFGFFNATFPMCKVVEKVRVFRVVEEFRDFSNATKLRLQYEMHLKGKEYLEAEAICEQSYQNLTNLVNSKRHPKNEIVFLKRFSAIGEYVSIITNGVKNLPKKFRKNTREWLNFLIDVDYLKDYVTNKKGFYYLSLATFLISDNENNLAAEVLIKALENTRDYVSEVTKLELSMKASSLARMKKNKIDCDLKNKIKLLSFTLSNSDFPSISITSKSVESNDKRSTRRVYETRSDDGSVDYMSVEDVALSHFRSQYPCGDHFEGKSITAIFTILFWDIIYEANNVPGAFLVRRIQHTPIDMYENSELFYKNRQAAIRKRLNELRIGWCRTEIRNFVYDTYRSNAHTIALNQQRVDSVFKDAKMMYDLIKIMDRGVLVGIMERLARNFREAKSGFPDLLLWNIENKMVKFVEVKSPNDVLSMKQKWWIDYLLNIGADVQVCFVKSTGGRKRSAKNY